MNFQSCFAIEREGTLGAFSPSDWLGGDRRNRTQEAARELYASHQLSTKFAPNCFSSDGIRAGTVSDRISDIHSLLDDMSVCALIATYGGKACNQLIYELPYAKLLERRLPVLGFSDVAVIQNAITARTGLVTFYGPNILAKLSQSTWNGFENIVAGSPLIGNRSIFGRAPTGSRCIREGRAQGRLFGGNLECFVYGVLLSKIDLSFFDGGIFFWESGGLTPREADQILTALANFGFLSRISGMIIGDSFSEEQYEWFRSDPLDSVANATRSFDFPILYYPSFGHKQLENPPIPIGAMSEMRAEDMYVSTIEEYVAV